MEYRITCFTLSVRLLIKEVMWIWSRILAPGGSMLPRVADILYKYSVGPWCEGHIRDSNAEPRIIHVTRYVVELMRTNE